jgi:hypothetical protein
VAGRIDVPVTVAVADGTPISETSAPWRVIPEEYFRAFRSSTGTLNASAYTATSNSNCRGPAVSP